MRQRLSLLAAGRPWEDRPRSEPDSGNPTVRDRREACGNVAVMGVGLRPTGKPVESPPNPTPARASHFYPDTKLWEDSCFCTFEGYPYGADAERAASDPDGPDGDNQFNHSVPCVIS